MPIYVVQLLTFHVIIKDKICYFVSRGFVLLNIWQRNIGRTVSTVFLPKRNRDPKFKLLFLSFFCHGIFWCQVFMSYIKVINLFITDYLDCVHESTCCTKHQSSLHGFREYTSHIHQASTRYKLKSYICMNIGAMRECN